MWFFCVLKVTFYSLILFQNKNNFKCTNEAAIRKSLEIANSNNINRPMRLQLTICHKKNPFFALFYKTRANTQQVLPEQTGLQRWSRGHKARGQGHKRNPRPRTTFPKTDLLEAKDRIARGQGPRTQPRVLKKKRSSKKFFRQSPIYRQSQNF